MKIEITYIFHNCFIVQIPVGEGNRTFLFDYPADQYLNETMRAKVAEKIRDTDLYVFSSHNHYDHFNRNTALLGEYTKSITYILSKDIIKRNRKYKVIERCYTIEPDQSYQIEGLEIYSFLSNDEGVAFLIKIPDARDLTVYFGGDLANWDWDDNNDQEKRFLEDYFGEVLKKLNKWPIQIAFSNTDARLPNWAGAAQFIKTVKPRLFIPMHAFGEIESITRFINENPCPGTEIFKYRETGDTSIFEL